MDLKELSQLTDNDFDKEHECHENVFIKDIKVLHSTLESGSWLLLNSRFASNEEVQMKEAEYEGELLYFSMFAVSFCPFCGKKLTP